MTSSESPVPGWYPDPHNPAQIRFWDGVRWTESVAPAGGVPVQPQPQPQLAAGGHYGVPAVYQASGAHTASHGLGDIGSWLSSLVSVLFDRAAPVMVLLFGIPFVGWVVAVVLWYQFVGGFAFDNRTDEFTGFSPPLLLAAIIGTVVAILLSLVGRLAALHQLHRGHLDRPESIGESLGFGLRRLPRTLAWGLLLVLATGLGIGAVTSLVVLLGVSIGGPEGVITGIGVGILAAIGLLPLAVYLWVKVFAFFLTSMAVGPGGLNPFKTTWSLARDRFWPLLGRLAILWALVQVVSSIISGISQFGILPLFSSVDVETDPVTGELLVDGIPVEDLDVIEFELFLPNVVVVIFLMAILSAASVATQAFSDSGVVALYVRAGGPNDLDG